ncbi:MAG: glycerophosphodiester phosphodiesterase family protein [Propionicimonas sp.]
MTEIWAHRGASGYAPENTMPAFELAVDQGAEGVEFDVQLSRDGAMVIIHDEILGRTADGTGRVADHTLAELQALDACNGMVEYAGVSIPTLDEVLALLAPTGLRINVELKNSEQPYPGLERKVIAAVADHGLSRRVVLSSFSDASVALLHELAPELELATLYTRPELLPWRNALSLGARGIHPPAPFVPHRWWISRAHALGLAIRPWVVNSPQLLTRMFRWRADAVFTDTPDVALELRDQPAAAR